MFQQDLVDLNSLFNFSDLSIFTDNMPIEWVESALKLSSSATIRRRRLPADQVLWLVLGMAIFRDEPIHEVARRLNICAQGLASLELLARSGLTEARKRLGADPVEWLFRQTGQYWGYEMSDIQMIIGRGFKSLLSMVRSSGLRIRLICVSTLAQATLLRSARRHFRCYGSSR